MICREGEVYRVAGGQTAEQKDRTKVIGSRPRGIEGEEPEVDLLSDVRDIRLWAGNSEGNPTAGEVD